MHPIFDTQRIFGSCSADSRCAQFLFASQGEMPGNQSRKVVSFAYTFHGLIDFFGRLVGCELSVPQKRGRPSQSRHTEATAIQHRSRHHGHVISRLSLKPDRSCRESLRGQETTQCRTGAGRIT